ncbi:hypothetical protein AKJ16_DCAP25740, partial [Drosera capensis]
MCIGDDRSDEDMFQSVLKPPSDQSENLAVRSITSGISVKSSNCCVVLPVLQLQSPDYKFRRYDTASADDLVTRTRVAGSLK